MAKLQEQRDEVFAGAGEFMDAQKAGEIDLLMGIIFDIQNAAQLQLAPALNREGWGRSKERKIKRWKIHGHSKA